MLFSRWPVAKDSHMTWWNPLSSTIIQDDPWTYLWTRPYINFAWTQLSTYVNQYRSETLRRARILVLVFFFLTEGLLISTSVLIGGKFNWICKEFRVKDFCSKNFSGNLFGILITSIKADTRNFRKKYQQNVLQDIKKYTNIYKCIFYQLNISIISYCC